MPNTKADAMLDPLRVELSKLRARIVAEMPEIEWYCNQIEDEVDELAEAIGEDEVDEHADCPQVEIE